MQIPSGFVLGVLGALFFGLNSIASQTPWSFVVSGDSRNCGDVVMPTIAQKVAQRAQIKSSALKGGIHFYWHLGDFRANNGLDEDLAHDPQYRSKNLSLSEYRAIAWNDFIDQQIKPFGSIPVFLTIGNHEMINRSRKDYISAFRDWVDSAVIHETRVKDGDDGSTPKTYYHWTDGGVDFISLDNSTHDQFDAEQMAWFQKRIFHDETDPKIKTVVVGMHAALPDSISFGHSMSESDNPVAVESGRKVYHELLKVRDKYRKEAYILASHSHFFMEGTFNTDYWKKNGGILPGWIVGTAGAQRNHLPKDSKRATKALEQVYGYLLATVSSGGKVRFEFQPLKKADVPPQILQRYGSDLVGFCFDENARR